MTETTTNQLINATVEGIVRHLAGADSDLVLTVRRAKSARSHMLSAFADSLKARVAGDSENEDAYDEMAREYAHIYQYRVEKAAGRVHDLTGIDEAFAARVIVTMTEE